MKKHYKILVYILFTLSGSDLFAQTLIVGSTLPEVSLTQIIRYKRTSAQLSDFRGKPLLLCFWNTTCSAGISFLPTLDSVQKRWKEKMEVLVVTNESQATIKQAFEDKGLLRHVALPVVVGNSTLRQLFPHRTEPHMVWVNSRGIVSAITGHNEITFSTLQSFIDDKIMTLPVKSETLDDTVYFSMKPLFEIGDAKGEKNMLVYSFLGGYREGVLPRSHLPYFDKDKGQSFIKAMNISLIRLFQMAHVGLQPLHPSRVIIEEAALNEREKEDLYCYELIIKDSSRQKALNIMISELDRAFGIESAFEKRRIKVFVLKRTSEIDKLKATGTEARDIYFKDGIQYVRNASWRGLKDIIFNHPARLAHYVVDETGYSGNVNMELVFDGKDLSYLHASLKKYDLELIEEEKEIAVLILKKDLKSSR